MKNQILEGISTQRNQRREGWKWGEDIIYPVSVFSYRVIVGCNTMIQMQRKFMHPYVMLIPCHRFLGQDKQAGISSPLDKLFQKVNKTSPKSTLHSLTQSFPEPPSAKLFHIKRCSTDT